MQSFFQSVSRPKSVSLNDYIQHSSVSPHRHKATVLHHQHQYQPVYHAHFRGASGLDKTSDSQMVLPFPYREKRDLYVSLLKCWEALGTDF